MIPFPLVETLFLLNHELKTTFYQRWKKPGLLVSGRPAKWGLAEEKFDLSRRNPVLAENSILAYAPQTPPPTSRKKRSIKILRDRLFSGFFPSLLFIKKRFNLLLLHTLQVGWANKPPPQKKKLKNSPKNTTIKNTIFEGYEPKNEKKKQ